VAKQTREELQQAVMAQEAAVIRLARENRDVFKSYVLKDDAGAEITQGEIHKSWSAHEERVAGLKKYCGIIAPWGHGKTEQCVIGDTLFDLARNPNLRIKIISNSDANARKRIMSIRKYIESSPEFRRVFPEIVRDTSGAWNDHELFIKRDGYSKDPSIEGAGIFSSGVGGRADKLVFDDPVDLKNAIQEPGSRVRVIEAAKQTWLSRLDPREGVLNYVQVLWIATVWHVDDATCSWVMKNSEFCVLLQSVNETMDAIESKLDGNNIPRLVGLWKPKFSSEGLQKKRRELGEAAFQRGFRNRPWSDEDIKLRSFATCLDESLTPAEALKQLGKNWRVVSGVDVAGKSRAGFAIFTGAVCVDTNVKIPLDIHYAQGGDAAIKYCREVVNRTFKPEVYMVECNATQDSFRGWLQTSGEGEILTEAFMTGAQKADPSVGIQSLDIEFANGLWVFPIKHLAGHDRGVCQCGWCRLIREISCYPSYETSDGVMAMWFARERMRGRQSLEELIAGIQGIGERTAGLGAPSMPEEMRPASLRVIQGGRRDGVNVFSDNSAIARMGGDW
jgi:hypothetical protein